MSKVVVIGAGASGIISALTINKNNEVILVDGNDKVGKKILLTGNGKCNYWNTDIDIDKYNTDNKEVLQTILDNKDKVLEYITRLGIYPHIKNGYYYPNSNQAASVREVLERNIYKKNIKFIGNFKVESIIKENNKFIIKGIDGKTIGADKVIISTGSKSFVKTGSDGTGYILAKNLGHTINKVTPSLVPLCIKGKYMKNWAGIRCDARVSLYIDNEYICSEEGEIQLTDYGISGICVFNISGKVSKYLDNNNRIKIRINFLPNIDNCMEWLEKRASMLEFYTIEEVLESVLNYKLMFVILNESGIDKNKYWSELTDKEKSILCSNIEKFTVEVIDTLSFDSSQVCTGGVSLNEINPLTMESTIVPNLYIVGELLDVDGKCGGYNLAHAFITGFIAGRGI